MWIFLFFSLLFEAPSLTNYTETTVCNGKEYIVYLRGPNTYLRDLSTNSENLISEFYGYIHGLFCENDNLYFITLDYDINLLDKYYYFKYREAEQSVELIRASNDRIQGEITPHSFGNTMILKQDSGVRKYVFANETVVYETIFPTTTNFDRFATTPPFDIIVISDSTNLIIRDVIGGQSYTVLTNSSKILSLIKDENGDYYMLVSNDKDLYIYKIHSDFSITQIHSKRHDRVVEKAIFYKYQNSFYGYFVDIDSKFYVFYTNENYSNINLEYKDANVTKIQKSNLFPIYIKTGSPSSFHKLPDDFSILNKPTILYPNGVIDTYIHPDIYIQSPNRADFFSIYLIDISRNHDFFQIDKSILSFTISDEDSQKIVVNNFSFSVATPYYIRARYSDIFSRNSEYSYGSFVKNSNLNLLTLSVYDKTTNSTQFTNERDVILYTQGEANLQNIELSFNSEFSESQYLSVGGEQFIELPNFEGVCRIFVRGVILDQSNRVAFTNTKETTIFLDSIKPTAPQITSPNFFDNTPQFSWNPSSDTGSGLSNYILNVKKDGVNIYQKELPKESITHQIETNLQNGTYNFEIFSVDLAGNISNSSTQNITIAKKPQAITELNILFESLTPTLTFQDNNSIQNKSYNISLFKGDIKLTEWTLFDQNLGNNSKTLILPKFFYKHNENYKFFLTISDGISQSDSTMIESRANLVDLKPNISTIISESGELSSKSYTLQFSSVIAPTGESINYKIYKNSLLYSEITTTQQILTNLVENERYLIEVEACDNSISLCSDRDSIDIFINEIEEVPTKVEILEPLNNSIIKSVPFDIRWSESIDPEGETPKYNLVISDKADFSKVVLEFFEIEDTKKTILSLKGGKYYLKVIAKDSKGKTSQSSEIILEIESKSSGSSGCSFY